MPTWLKERGGNTVVVETRTFLASPAEDTAVTGDHPRPVPLRASSPLSGEARK
jgi:hypothetical protein